MPIAIYPLFLPLLPSLLVRNKPSLSLSCANPEATFNRQGCGGAGGGGEGTMTKGFAPEPKRSAAINIGD